MRNEFLSYVEKKSIYRNLIAADTVDELAMKIKHRSVGQDRGSRLYKALNDAEKHFGIDNQIARWNELFANLLSK